MILYPKPSRHLTNVDSIYQVPHSAQLMNTLYPCFYVLGLEFGLGDLNPFPKPGTQGK